MARKEYHIGMNVVKTFIKENRGKLGERLREPALFEYSKLFGNAYYELQLLSFLKYFKIEKHSSYSLEVISFFKSNLFAEKILDTFNITNLTAEKSITAKDLFYILCFVISEYADEEVKNRFYFKTFLFYIFQINPSSKIDINYKDMALQILRTKNKNIEISESFGPLDTEMSFFKILKNGDVSISLEGTSIKTLRKKAYKKLFFEALDATASL